MSEFRPVLLLPHYNHIEQLRRFLPALQATGYPILVVDDGSDGDELEILRKMAALEELELVVHTTNRGKGAAVMTGFVAAAQTGYTHALQIDADGQHDPSDIVPLLERARRSPSTLVCGEPQFGADMPAARKYGRKLTDFFVILETWTFTIRDSMCGLRVYPLAETLALLERQRPGERMDFDIEMLVFAFWQGIELDFVKTRVKYPENGLSHFHYFRDNVKIIAMHARLLLGMFPRIPSLLMRHFRQPKWAKS